MLITIENNYPYSDGMVLGVGRFMNYSYHASMGMSHFNLRQALVLASNRTICKQTHIEFGTQNEVWKISRRIFRAYNEEVGESV